MNIFFLFRICFLYNTNKNNNKSILLIFQLKLPILLNKFIGVRQFDYNDPHKLQMLIYSKSI